jgi:hypothetical protein
MLDVLNEPSANYSTMSHDEYTKLFKYMQQGFAEIREEFNKIYEQFDRFYGTFDNHEKRLETGKQERLVQNAQLDRHEQRITGLENNSI